MTVLDQRVIDVLHAQHGIVAARQLERLGVSRARLRTALDNGWLVTVAPGVYASNTVAPTFESRLMTGLLALGPGAVVSHRSGAALHGFDRFPPDVAEFTVPRAGRNRSGALTVHSTRVLPPIDRVCVDGFACTSATRTVIDLARLRISRYQLEAAIDSAVRLGLSSPIVLVDRLSALRGPGRWGAPLLDRLLVDSGGHTMLERRFLELVRRAGLPRPTTQVLHRHEGRAYARVDFLFEQAGIVVEVSGAKGHSSPSERARDAQRRNELQEAGRLVYEYTWDDVVRRGDYVTESLRRRLTAATTALVTGVADHQPPA